MGTGNSAGNAAATADAARQASITNSVNQIQSAYNSPNRKAQVDQYGTALNQFYTGQVNNQEQVNARNLKFANARSGLIGGSEAVDSNNQLQKDYTQGLVQAAQQANAGKAALSTADQNSQNQLVSLAQAGNYTGAIPAQVAQTQLANLNAAGNYAGANTLNNIFSGTAGIYQSEQIAAANRRAQINPIGSIYGTPTSPGTL